MAAYVARLTNLHPKLWAPYSIVAYPYGFHEWPEEYADPVWDPHVRLITPSGPVSRSLGDCSTLDDALAACWAHFVTLGEG